MEGRHTTHQAKEEVKHQEGVDYKPMGTAYTKEEIEKNEGTYDEDGFYNLKDGGFYDPYGYKFDKDGYDEFGGYYDDDGYYVPGEGYEEEYYGNYGLGDEEEEF